MIPEEVDYIVIGSGAAGSTVAARLSEAKEQKVLLLEAGGSDRRLSVRVPGLAFIAISNSDLNWSFQVDPTPALNGRSQIFLAGKLIGGSSSINGMIYSRGHS